MSVHHTREVPVEDRKGSLITSTGVVVNCRVADGNNIWVPERITDALQPLTTSPAPLPSLLFATLSY